jgi:hypothetical protein
MSDEEKRYFQKSIGGMAPFTAPPKSTKVKTIPEEDSMKVSSTDHGPREGDTEQDEVQNLRAQIARMQGEHEMLKSRLVEVRMENAKYSPAYHDGSEQHYQTPQRPTYGRAPLERGSNKSRVTTEKPGCTITVASQNGVCQRTKT